jgi:sortase A
MRKHKSTVALLTVFLIGLSLMLYPVVANYVNEKHETRAIAAYEENISKLSTQDYSAIEKAAEEYNAELASQPASFNLSQAQTEEYDKLMDPTGIGVMGYIEIPAIGVSLPIYHGVSDEVLAVGAGHIPGSSLPVGGASTHCALSGHRGLPSARLFTDIDQLQKGDTFMLHVLDKVLEYQVDQILVVEPDDVAALGVTQGEDLCTLVTCTPYGINTQRLLVRGHRIPYDDSADEAADMDADAEAADPMIVASLIAAFVLIILLVCLLIRTSRPRRENRGEDENE